MHTCSLVRVRYRAAEDAQAQWAAFTSANDITVSSCPKVGPFRYEKQMEEHVMKAFQHMWPKWENYDNCKSVYNQLRDWGIHKDTLVNRIHAHLPKDGW